jgi:hypothetical protein
MKLIPPPPPASAGAGLFPAPEMIAADFVSGILSGCVMCTSSTATYWPDGGRFHPLHRQCIGRLIEHWRTLLDGDEDGQAAPVAQSSTGGRLRGAYARRAVKAGGATAHRQSTPGLAPVVPESVQRNRFWQPGMDPETLWTVVRETTVSRSIVPRYNEVGAKEEMRRQEVASEVDAIELDRGIITLGGCVVAPDGSIAASWGEHSDPAGSPIFRPMHQVQGWTQCRGCSTWRWPGCWLLDTMNLCQSCAAPDDGRPWPVDPPALGGRTEPPPPPPKKKSTKDRALN